MAVTLVVGKGRNTKTFELANLTRQQVHLMTEKTQMDFFGEVIMKKYPRSISGRRVE
jgi:hypothetical protein